MGRFDNVKILLLTAVFMLLCPLIWALTICGKCGHEIRDGATTCAHCGTAVEKKEVALAPAPVKEEKGVDPVGQMAEDFVRKQYQLAQEAQESDPGLAFAYYQNAFAVLRLVAVDDISKRVGETIMQNIRLCRKAMCTGRVPCRFCKGTGKYMVDVGKFTGTRNMKFVDGVQCRHCKGLGYTVAHLSVERIKMNVLKGRQSFEQRMMVGNHRKLGRASVSEELYAALSLRQRVLVMTGIPAPCENCQYTGLDTCRECRGSGWVKCPVANCKNGIVEDDVRSSGGSSIKKKRLNEDTRKICGVCQGLGEIPCRVCQGTGCEICKDCGGTGEGPRCNKCQGTGLIDCPRCGGTGQYKGERCDKCAGEGVIICSGCKGEGTVSR
jgi:hypothetical protein